MPRPPKPAPRIATRESASVSCRSCRLPVTEGTVAFSSVHCCSHERAIGKPTSSRVLPRGRHAAPREVVRRVPARTPARGDGPGGGRQGLRAGGGGRRHRARRRVAPDRSTSSSPTRRSASWPRTNAASTACWRRSTRCASKQAPDWLAGAARGRGLPGAAGRQPRLRAHVPDRGARRRACRTRTPRRRAGSLRGPARGGPPPRPRRHPRDPRGRAPHLPRHRRRRERAGHHPRARARVDTLPKLTEAILDVHLALLVGRELAQRISSPPASPANREISANGPAGGRS